ncbi:MAG: hypothetical protein RBT34_10745, partial [Anaerolineaceae bacterium]|nr:hypothetical protein [Anaerolineaceae bacterium]
FSGTRTGSSVYPNLKKLNIKPATMFGIIIFSALFAFEMFNYSTTDFALRDLLGDLKFVGLRWSTILAIAFCGIDFAGIARLFTPEQGRDEPKAVWYLFGAWFLAAIMNALLTWWGVSMAIASHNVQSAAVINPATLTRVVPIFVALMVWVIRILIIGTLTVAGEKLLWENKRPSYSRNATNNNVPLTNNRMTRPQPAVSRSAAPRAAAPRNTYHSNENQSRRPDPTYHSLSASGGDQSSHNRPSRQF